MKTKRSLSGDRFSKIRIEFRVTSEHIEAAIASCLAYHWGPEDRPGYIADLTNGLRKSTVERELRRILHDYGAGRILDDDGPFVRLPYGIGEATGRELFPEFYEDREES